MRVSLSFLIVIIVMLSGCHKSSMGRTTKEDPAVASGGSGSKEGDSDEGLSVRGLANQISDDQVTISIEGSDAVAFKYKLGSASTTDCSDEVGYGDEQVLGDSITIDLTTSGEGDLVFCILTKGKNGKWQDYEDATDFTFERDSTAPAIVGDTTLTSNGPAILNPDISETATYVWSKISGPGTISFNTAFSVPTTATPSVDGTYVVRLTATDSAGNASTFDTTITWDTTAPPDVDGFTATTGSNWRAVGLAITLPADVTDFDRIEIRRTAPSAVTSVTAPTCSNGVVASSLSDFTNSPINVTDYTSQGGQYYSYRLCIYDAVGNLKSSLTDEDVLSMTETAPVIEYNAANYDGSGTVSGDIGAETTTAWTDAVGTTDGTLNNFDFDANSGWDGSGSASDPYRLKFDGSNDAIAIGSLSAHSYSIWFKPDILDTTARHILGKNWTRVYLHSGALGVAFNSSSSLNYQWIPLTNTGWNHIVIAAGTKYFLNGNLIMDLSTSSGADTNQTAYIGSDYTGAAGFFDGSIGLVQIYNTVLSLENVRHLYASTRSTYEADDGSLAIERMSGLQGPTDNSGLVTIHGKNLDSITSVSFGGIAANNIQQLNDHFLKVTPPSGTDGTTVDISISDGSNTSTYSDVYQYSSAAVLPNLHWDAANIDSLGARGTSASNDVWQSLATKEFSSQLVNFSLPGDSNSGWAGDGSTSNPYQLKFDGINDMIYVGTNAARAYSVWFKADNIDATARYIFRYYSSAVASFAYLQSGNLTVRYYDSVGSASIAVNEDTWYHLVIFLDGTTSRYYLDGAEFGTDTTGIAETSSGGLRIGAIDNAGTNPFDGAIGEFSLYGSNITPAAAVELFNATKARYGK